VASLKGFGGYFKRYHLPAVFKDVVDQNTGEPLGNSSSSALTPEQRIQLSFLKADVSCTDNKQMKDNNSQDKEPVQVGSTGSVAIVRTNDRKPFWDSEQYDIFIAHVGDTR
jgi:protein phosphatase PTC6